MKTLTNFDIDNEFTDYKNYGGCISRDYNGTLKNKFYIMNMDVKTGGGSHWCLIYNVSKGKIIYVDSFGIGPPKNILNLIRATKKRFFFNDVDIQRLNSKSCGEFCVVIAKLLDASDGDIKILIPFYKGVDFSENLVKSLF